MQSRPLAITVVAALFLAVGVAGTVRSFAAIVMHPRFSSSDFWVPLLSLLAIVCGVFLLRRQSWARWLALAWMAAHVAIGFLNSLQNAVVHALFLLLIACLVFRPEANAWFRISSGKVQ
jgi:hypothetical protein